MCFRSKVMTNKVFSRNGRNTMHPYITFVQTAKKYFCSKRMAKAQVSMNTHIATFCPVVTGIWLKLRMYGKVKVSDQGHSWRSLKFLSALQMLVITIPKKFDFDTNARFCSSIVKSMGKCVGRRVMYQNNIDLHRISRSLTINDVRRCWIYK